MINNLFNNLDDIINTRKHKKQELKRWNDKKEKHYLLLENLEEARTIFQHASKITQSKLSNKLSNTVTSALASVYENPYKFKVEFVERRNVTECDLLFEKNGNTKNPLRSCGYGAADIAVLALRVAYWKLTHNRNTLLLDEPTRNLDVDKQPLAALMLQSLHRAGKEQKLQFIIVTHKKALTKYADKIFKIKQKNGISNILLEEKIKNKALNKPKKKRKIKINKKE